MSEVGAPPPPATEMKPPPSPEMQQFAALPIEQRVHKLESGISGFIRGKLDKGEFGESDSESHKKATSALSYDSSKRGNGENSEALKNQREILAGIKGDEIAEGIVPKMDEVLVIRLGEGADAETFTYEAWQKKLESAATPEERAELEGKGIWDYPQQENQQADQTPEQGSPLDRATEVIRERIGRLRVEVGLQTEPGKAKRLRDLLGILETAEAANGDLGVLMKLRAVQYMEASRQTGLGQLRERLGPEAETAYGKLTKHLEDQGMSAEGVAQLVQRVKKHGIEAVLDDGILSKVEGLDTLIFGKEMTDEQAQKLLEGHMPQEKAQAFFKKYGKKAGTGLLLGLLLGVVGGVGMISSAAKG